MERDEAALAALMAAFERLDARPVTEIGVPMLLVPEDGAASPGAGGADPLGAEFARMADLLERRRGEPTARDLARIAEILAERATGEPSREPRAGPGASAAFGPRPGAPPAGPWRDLAAAMGRGRAIAVVNYHSTPARRRGEYAAQVARLAERFDPLTEDGLDAITAGAVPPRPVVMPILFEGFRDQLDVILPLLEEAGLTAWMMIPPGFLDLDPEDQRPYAAAHALRHAGDERPGERPDERIAMTWDEARDVASRGHVFGCHSRGHFELRPETPDAVLEWEIAGGQALMERRLGRPARLFCWLRGAALGLNPRADAILARAGFRHLLSNLRIQRLA